jgi:hypothetical protein
MRVDKRPNWQESNDIIIDLIKNKEKFMISRVGLGGETAVSVLTLSNQEIPSHVYSWFTINAGFYGSQDFLTYAKYYKAACDTSNLHAYWGAPGFTEMEDFLVSEDKPIIDPSALDSFRLDNPWTEHLKDKKILIISPFKETIDKQLLIKDKIWENKNVLPDAEYITYKSVQSIGGQGPDKDWYESYNKMCEDISKIDFDVALLGCGAYGLPLCNFITNKLNKSSIYNGGSLQLYFGIKGRRWESDVNTTKFYNEHWVRPTTEETPTASTRVEGGCYW